MANKTLQLKIGNTTYRRFCTNGTWGNWKEDKLTDTTYTSLKNPCALTLKINSGGGTAYDGSSPNHV